MQPPWTTGSPSTAMPQGRASTNSQAKAFISAWRVSPQTFSPRIRWKWNCLPLNSCALAPSLPLPPLPCNQWIASNPIYWAGLSSNPISRGGATTRAIRIIVEALSPNKNNWAPKTDIKITITEPLRGNKITIKMKATTNSIPIQSIVHMERRETTRAIRTTNRTTPSLSLALTLPQTAAAALPTTPTPAPTSLARSKRASQTLSLLNSINPIKSKWVLHHWRPSNNFKPM